MCNHNTNVAIKVTPILKKNKNQMLVPRIGIPHYERLKELTHLNLYS